MNLKTQVLAAFKEMGVKPRVFHITGTEWFTGITVATTTASKHLKQEILNVIGEFEMDSFDQDLAQPTTCVIARLNAAGFHGVAICDHRDQFSRKRGWLISCGRLLKHLQEAKEQ